MTLDPTALWEAHERAHADNVLFPWFLGSLTAFRSSVRDGHPEISIEVDPLMLDVVGFGQLMSEDRKAIKHGRALAFPMLRNCWTCRHAPNGTEFWACHATERSEDRTTEHQNWIFANAIRCSSNSRTADNCPEHQWPDVSTLIARGYVLDGSKQ